jgi:hypothetical protein
LVPDTTLDSLFRGHGKAQNVWRTTDLKEITTTMFSRERLAVMCVQTPSGAQAVIVGFSAFMIGADVAKRSSVPGGR